jgi:hypothetical protein
VCFHTVAQGLDEGHRDLAVFLDVDVAHAAAERTCGEVVPHSLRRAIEHGEPLPMRARDGRSRPWTLEVLV